MKPMFASFACATLAACVIGLTACASPEEVRAADRATCQGYGFKDGSDAFANCMMKTADDRRKRNEAIWKSNEAAIGQAPAAKPSTTACKSTETVTSTAADGTVTTDSSSICISQ